MSQRASKILSETTPITSASRVEDLITPNVIDNSLQQVIPTNTIPVPLVKNTALPFSDQAEGISSAQATATPIGVSNQINSFANAYGQSYGGYGGMSGYGNYGYGGMYGMGYGGMYGMGYGGMYGRNQNDKPDFLDLCFTTAERTNYQLFHFCEMARMIQAQGPALAYFFDILRKIWNYVKNLVISQSKAFIDFTKFKLIGKLLLAKKQIREFFTISNPEDSQLRSQIKALDYMITALLISAIVGIFLKVYS